MADTFISYSRKDIAFAKIIHKSLQNNQIDPWIDWQDIPPSTNWFDEIKEAIEQADTFIFIISPTSVQSEICSKEVAHAEQNNKRLIPIVIGDIKTQTVPSTLQPLNWIFFKEEDKGYSKALEDLIAAITTDQPWLKAHTRIQNRALEWERSDQENGYLLHGADLEEAEQWLAQAAGKEPEPTTLQTQYVLASRAQATRRQRMTLAGVAVGLVVAVVLGIFAWTQRNVAVSEGNMRATAQVEAEHAEATAVEEAFSRATQQAIAEEQRNIAESKGLAALSLSSNETELDLALLLAVEGLNKRINYDTKNAMMHALTAKQNQIRSVKLDEEGPILAAANNSDMSQVAASANSKIHVFDPIAGTLLYPVIDLGDVRVTDIAFSPDDQILAGAADNGQIYLWEASTGQPLDYVLNPLESQVSEIEHIHFVGNSTVVGMDEYLSKTRLIFWDVLSGQITRVVTIRDDQFSDFSSDLAISDDQKLVAVTGYQTIYIYDTETQELFADPIETGGLFQALAISPDNKTLAAAGLQIKMWNIETGEEVNSPWRHDDGNIIDQLLFISDDLLLSADKNYIYYWQGETMEKVAKWSYHGIPKTAFTRENIKLDPGGRILIVGEAYGKVSLYSIYRDLPGRIPFEYPGYTLNNLIFSKSGDLVFAKASSLIADEDIIIAWDAASGELYGEPIFTGIDGINKFEISPDGQIIACYDGGQGNPIMFWEAGTGEKLDKTLAPDGDEVIADFLFYPDSTHLAAATFERNLYLFDYANSTLVKGPLRLSDQEEPNNEKMLITKNGGRLIIESHYEDIRFYNAETLNPIGDPIPRDQVNDMSPSDISPDNEYLVGFNPRGDLILWNIKSGEIEAQILDINTEMGVFPTASFSPNGSMVAARFDNFFQLFEVPTLAPLGPKVNGNFRHLNVSFENTDPLLSYDGHFYPRGTLEFSPDGSTLLLGGADNLRMVITNIDAWIEQACFRAGRNLTEKEWALYLPFDEYRKTCPQYP